MRIATHEQFRHVLSMFKPGMMFFFYGRDDLDMYTKLESDKDEDSYTNQKVHLDYSPVYIGAKFFLSQQGRSHPGTIGLPVFLTIFKVCVFDQPNGLIASTPKQLITK